MLHDLAAGRSRIGILLIVLHEFFGYVVWYIPCEKLHCHFPSLCLSFMSLTMAILRPSYHSISYVLSPSFENGLAILHPSGNMSAHFSFSLQFLPMIINLGDFPLQLTYSNLHDIGLRACASEKFIPSLRFWFG